MYMKVAPVRCRGVHDSWSSKTSAIRLRRARGCDARDFADEFLSCFEPARELARSWRQVVGALVTSRAEFVPGVGRPRGQIAVDVSMQDEQLRSLRSHARHLR